ncbi:MAG: hypothetical protein KJN80_00765 [Deltaproteobacteria bacterium]|nr:hypothetical protein [Deltaproteobacteria bacterium]
MIDNDRLCQKIRKLYPDVGECGIDVAADALDDLSPTHSNAPHTHPVTSEKKKGAANVG